MKLSLACWYTPKVHRNILKSKPIATAEKWMTICCWFPKSRQNTLWTQQIRLVLILHNQIQQELSLMHLREFPSEQSSIRTSLRLYCSNGFISTISASVWLNSDVCMYYCHNFLHAHDMHRVPSLSFKITTIYWKLTRCPPWQLFIMDFLAVVFQL